MTKLLILGAGGHSNVVAEIAQLMGTWNDISHLDDVYGQEELSRRDIIGVLHDFHLFRDEYKFAFVAIGDNTLRLEWTKRLQESGYTVPTLIHPSAMISKSSHIDVGTVVMPGVVISTNVRIGSAGIINTSSSIDHDCILDPGVHISPGVHIGGTVKIGPCSWIGIGASIINNIHVGSNVIVAAGATVTNHVPDHVMVCGVPARIKKSLE